MRQGCVRDAAHPREGRQRIERSLLCCNVIARGAEQPAATGSDEARLVSLRAECREQLIEESPIDRGHVAVEVAGRMDDGIELRQTSGPSLGRCDVARKRRRADGGELERGSLRSCQTEHRMPARDQLSHDSGANRACATKHKNSHVASMWNVEARPQWTRTRQAVRSDHILRCKL